MWKPSLCTNGSSHIALTILAPLPVIIKAGTDLGRQVKHQFVFHTWQCVAWCVISWFHRDKVQIVFENHLQGLRWIFPPRISHPTSCDNYIEKLWFIYVVLEFKCKILWKGLRLAQHCADSAFLQPFFPHSSTPIMTDIILYLAYVVFSFLQIYIFAYLLVLKHPSTISSNA